MKERIGYVDAMRAFAIISVVVAHLNYFSFDNCNSIFDQCITAFFMPRRAGDRPDVIPDGCVNAAFLGQFAETPRDTIFTTEYSVRTAMEAVYGEVIKRLLKEGLLEASAQTDSHIRLTEYGLDVSTYALAEFLQ